MGEIVSKSEFARRIGRTPGRVTQWITEGRLTAPAVVGVGRASRIDYDAAVEQLRSTLDPAQQLSQPAPILAPIGPSRQIGDLVANDEAGPGLAGNCRQFGDNSGPTNAARQIGEEQKADRSISGATAQPRSDQARLLAAKADREELARERERAKNLELDGTYVLTAEVRKTWGAHLSALLTALESWSANEVVKIVERELPRGRSAAARAVVTSFRGLRTKLAKEHKA